MLESPPRRLGDFELVRELGHGGMGIVYEARQVSLNRTVALKVLSGGLGLTPKAIQRFRREAEAAAKLHHTNIVPVYATGEHDGSHFYAMELIDGPSLDVVIRQNRGSAGNAKSELPAELGATAPHVSSEPTPLSTSSATESSSSHYFDRAATMIADVADALHYAHQNNVTHRDIKPSNLLVSADGRLSVTDFGLARMLEQPGMTITGEFMGTPAYMSPEQIAAGRVPLDHRTDIYSLGATLYELLTLRPPFKADGRDQLLAMVIQKEPASPRTVNPKIPRDLETICQKCLEKDPDRRYQNAKDMADDLRRYVNRFAILAKRAGPLTRLKKWMARNPAMAGGALAVLLALGVAGFFAWQAKLDRERLQTDQRQAAVDKALLEAFSGEAHAALEAIIDAESKGAEPSRLNVLRGVVEIYRGRPKDALMYLLKAEEQLPNSVAVKAMLTKAYWDSDQQERADETLKTLEHLQPKTDEDRLLLGIVQSETTDSDVGLRTMDTLPARYRQLPVARLARVYAQIFLAQRTGRPEDAAQAQADIRRVEMPDNSWALGCSVLANMAVVHACGPKDPRSDEALKQAQRDANKLAESVYRHNPLAVFYRLNFFFARGDDYDDALLEVVRKARKDRVELPFISSMELNVLYRLGEFKECLRILEENPSEGRETRRRIEFGIVRATIKGQKPQAEDAFNDAILNCKSGVYLAFTPSFLQLLGPDYVKQSVKAADESRVRFGHLIPKIANDWYHHVLDYNAGGIDHTELLTKAGNNQDCLCEARFYIGLRKLGEGNRPEARKFFKSSMDTGICNFTEYIWSRAFLAHIDDPEWLPWCHAKK